MLLAVKTAACQKCRHVVVCKHARCIGWVEFVNNRHLTVPLVRAVDRACVWFAYCKLPLLNFLMIAVE